MSTITIKPRGNSYQASLTLKRAKVRLRKSFSTPQEAELWALKKRQEDLQDVATYSSRPGGSMTLKDLMEYTYARHWAGTKGEDTALLNSKAVVFLAGDHITADSVTTQDVEKMIEYLQRAGNSNATINRKLAALSKMLKVGKDLGVVTKLPTIRRLKEAQHRIRWISENEEAQLMGLIDPLCFVLIPFLVDTGCRLGEALSLKWTDFDKEFDCVHIWETKGGTPRTVPLSSRVKGMLLAITQRPYGPFQHLTGDMVTHYWNKARKVMGLENDEQFVPHCLRHTCASRMVRAGVDILVIKEWLGHKSLAMTLRYAHLSPKALLQARDKMEPSMPLLA